MRARDGPGHGHVQSVRLQPGQPRAGLLARHEPAYRQRIGDPPGAPGQRGQIDLDQVGTPLQLAERQVAPDAQRVGDHQPGRRGGAGRDPHGEGARPSRQLQPARPVAGQRPRQLGHAQLRQVGTQPEQLAEPARVQGEQQRALAADVGLRPEGGRGGGDAG